MPLAVAPAISPTFGFSERFPLFIATLIAPDRLTQGDISAARDSLAAAALEILGDSWIEPEKAAAIRFERVPELAARQIEEALPEIDVVVLGAHRCPLKLLVADMDSTMITVECLDELADYAGFKPQVAEITERAMRGEIDFAAALDERVSLLKGLPADIVTQCHEERVRISEGAIPLIRTMKAHGAHTVLVSGGFTAFADRVAEEIGFDRAVSNILGVADGKLTGTVERPLVDGAAKERLLQAEIERLEIDRFDALAVGDGANDKAMIEAAGFGVAYRGKPILRDAARIRLDRTDLSSLLYAQGIARKDWVEG